jgi:hypothetical protein
VSVRLYYDAPDAPNAPKTHRERSQAQKHTDHALDEAAKAASDALALVQSAVEWLGTVGQVKNRDAAHYVNKLVEEIAETRRVRG